MKPKLVKTGEMFVVTHLAGGDGKTAKETELLSKFTRLNSPGELVGRVIKQVRFYGATQLCIFKDGSYFKYAQATDWTDAHRLVGQSTALTYQDLLDLNLVSVDDQLVVKKQRRKLNGVDAMVREAARLDAARALLKKRGD